MVPLHLRRAALCGLYVITENLGSVASHEEIACAALSGGARIIQLRDKALTPQLLYPIALRLRRLTRRHRALLLINDRPDLALACDADGVHLGPDDLPPHAARRVLGPHRLIGVSCGTPEEARRALQSGADYVGAGAIFLTQTKLDAGEPIGLHGLRAIVEATSLPVAAIGGVSQSNIAELADCGAAMACVVSAVSRSGDEKQMTHATRELIARFGQPRFRQPNTPSS